jgi:hypothetical protein
MRGPVNVSSLPRRLRLPRKESAVVMSEANRRRRKKKPASGLAAIGLLAAGLLGAGCSSGTSPSKVGVGAITFTDVNGTPLKSPPSLLNSGQSAYLEVTLTNDPQNLGANWSVYCGSAPPPGTPPPPGQTQDQSCGTFTPAHTMSGPVPSYVTSGSGYVTLFTAPAAPPAQGTVTLYASSTSNPSRWSSVSLTVVGLPISVGFAPAPPASLGTGATAQLKAVVNNDAASAGVNWTTICGSSDCGSFNPVKTGSGVTTTYTAPASVPDGGTVQVVATSVTDPTKAASATISVTAANAGQIAGSVRASQQPVAGAQVTLYASSTSENSRNNAVAFGDESALSLTVTDEEGNFSLPDEYRCPSPNTQLYLVSAGGNAGGGANPNLALMAALGDCSKLGSSRITINEATTVAAVFALSEFMTDARHVGSGHVSVDAMATAFATANDLVDVAAGIVRTRTASGTGIIPQAKINTIANLLSACARTAGSAHGDGSSCDQLFAASNPGKVDETQAADTIQAMLDLARNATGFQDHPDSFEPLYALASSNGSFEPVLASSPKDWTLVVVFPAGADDRVRPGSEAPSIDAGGNVWVESKDGVRTEFVGGASCAGVPKVLLPVVWGLESAP